MEGLRADVARLALRVVGARLRRDRDGLGVLLICVVLLGAACFFYCFAELVVPAFFPMLHLAFGPAVACAAAAAFLAQGKAKLGGADGALREDHLVYMVKSLGGSPAMPKKPDFACKASVLQDASNRAVSLLGPAALPSRPLREAELSICTAPLLTERRGV